MSLISCMRLANLRETKKASPFTKVRAPTHARVFINIKTSTKGNIDFSGFLFHEKGTVPTVYHDSGSFSTDKGYAGFLPVGRRVASRKNVRMKA